MTDADVVEHVAAAFGTAAICTDRGNRRSVIYATRIKGSRAVALMQDLRPLMGRRRTEAIDAAIDAYEPPERKLSFLVAEEIRDLRERGATVSALARTFDVSRPTIRQVLDRSIYAAAPLAPWRSLQMVAISSLVLADRVLSTGELYWLAGWLEGEGSFVRPPPSDPRRARIKGITRDDDVAAQVGRLLNVKPLWSHPVREQRLGWSPTWRMLCRGGRAAELMRALRPLLGARRQSQIDAALSAASMP